MIDAGVRLTTVEAVYGQTPFDLPDRAGVRRVRLRINSKSGRAHAQDQYWHKESPLEMLDWGYPGGTWGYRRDAFEAMGGLLDVYLLGASDYHMAWATSTSAICCSPTMTTRRNTAPR